jgi:hypothetical protein
MQGLAAALLSALRSHLSLPTDVLDLDLHGRVYPLPQVPKPEMKMDLGSVNYPRRSRHQGLHGATARR